MLTGSAEATVEACVDAIVAMDDALLCEVDGIGSDMTGENAETSLRTSLCFNDKRSCGVRDAKHDPQHAFVNARVRA